MTDRDVLGRILRDFQVQARAWETQVAAVSESIRLLVQKALVPPHACTDVADAFGSYLCTCGEPHSATHLAAVGRTPPPAPEAP